jgi:hypothetical protein
VKVLGMKGCEAKVCVMWLREEFRECHPDANKAIVSQYTRAWVWHLFATVLFSNSIGDATSWMYIPCLVD